MTEQGRQWMWFILLVVFLIILAVAVLCVIATLVNMACKALDQQLQGARKRN